MILSRCGMDGVNYVKYFALTSSNSTHVSRPLRRKLMREKLPKASLRLN